MVSSNLLFLDCTTPVCTQLSCLLTQGSRHILLQSPPATFSCACYCTSWIIFMITFSWHGMVTFFPLSWYALMLVWYFFFRLFTYLVNSTVLTYFYLWEWLQWIYNILICYVPLFPHFLASLVWKNSLFFFFVAVVVVFKYAGVPYFSFSIFGTMQLLLFGVIVNNLI